MSFKWIPNAICFMRIALVAPVVLWLLEERYLAALVLIVVAGLSDAVDGFLAKAFDWRTRLGSLLDPAADKLLVTSVFVTLTYLGWVPIGVTAIVILRDVVIVTGALSYQLTVGRLTGQPTAISKLNTAFQLSFLVFTTTHAGLGWPSGISLVLLGAAVVFTSINSGLNYVVVWSTLAWQARHAEQG